MRIAFASFGSLGDLYPLLAIAVAAQGRGHDVAVAASPNYEDHVRRAGMEFYPLRPAIPSDPTRLAYYFDMRRGPERLLREVAFAEIANTHADLCLLAKGADLLVVGELLYTAPIVAEEMGVPWMNVVLAPTSFLSASDPCVLAPAPFLHPLRHLGRWVHQLAYIAGRIQGRLWAKEFLRFDADSGYQQDPIRSLTANTLPMARWPCSQPSLPTGNRIGRRIRCRRVFLISNNLRSLRIEWWRTSCLPVNRQWFLHWDLSWRILNQIFIGRLAMRLFNSGGEPYYSLAAMRAGSADRIPMCSRSTTLAFTRFCRDPRQSFTPEASARVARRFEQESPQ